MLKQLLYIVVFIVTINQAKAQAYIYHPFSTDTVKWIYYGINEHNQGCYSSYIQAGDTTFTSLPGKTYKKIFTSQIEDNSPIIYIREENKIIYTGYGDFGVEYELYNFTKTNINDTIKFINFNDITNPFKAKIAAFDSLQTANGLDYYKIYKLQPINYEWGESCYYIERNYLGEGIGCFPDLKYRCLGNLGCPCENNSFFNTLIINRDTIIKDLFFDCKLTNIEEIEIKKEEIKVYPNPVDNLLTINVCALNNILEKNYVLYNLQGDVVAKFTSNDCKVEFKTGHLQNGFYIWHVITNKESFTDKILVKHN